MTAYDGTPLHSAARWDHEAIISLLLAAGANTKLKDAEGKTAAQRAHTPAARALLG
jgi:ankyrin repeat protein